jgi:catechol 2,3-dioxygenase
MLSIQPHPDPSQTAVPAEPAFYPNTIRTVSLLTRNQARLGRFYADVLGLAEHSREVQESVWCLPTPEGTRQGEATLRLLEDTHAKMRPPRTTGLFHTAFLLPSRPALATATRALLAWSEKNPVIAFQGYSEHGVSEAVYGTDPDGNGIELTLDRPFAQWPRSDRPGERLSIISQPLSLRDLLQERSAPPVCIGFSHVHLNVSSLAAAETFLVDERQMQVMQRSYPGALFLAYGDYHHHLAVNVWEGTGVVAPPEATVGLLDVDVRTPTGEEWHLSNADLARN